MATKTISLTEEAYHRLAALKSHLESFSTIGKRCEEVWLSGFYVEEKSCPSAVGGGLKLVV